MLKLPDKIKTIVSENGFRLKEKGSVFVSISKPIANEDDVGQFLAALKKNIMTRLITVIHINW